MYSINYILNLAAYGCNGCAAYENLGHCGAWRGCQVAQDVCELEDFLEEFPGNFEDFINWLEYTEMVDIFRVNEADRLIAEYKDNPIHC